MAVVDPEERTAAATITNVPRSLASALPPAAGRLDAPALRPSAGPSSSPACSRSPTTSPSSPCSTTSAPPRSGPPPRRKVTAWHASTPPASPAWASTSTGRSTARRWRSAWASSPRPSTATPKLPLREREAARWTIALINDCVVCQDTRAKDAEAHAVDEGFYADVAVVGHHRRAHRAGEAGGRVRPALRPRPPGHGRRVLGAPARRLHRRRGGRPHHLLRDVPRPRAGHGRGRRAGARTSASCVCTPPQRPGGPMAAHDLIIRGGTVVDGTGAPGPHRRRRHHRRRHHRGRPGRRHGRRRSSTPTACSSRPGFVDIHVHYDGQATWDDRLIPSSWHGVTTVVAGNCGVGLRAGAPGRPRPAHRADGGRRGHPRRRPARGAAVDVAVVPRVPRRARRPPLRRRRRHPGPPRRAAPAT